MFKLDLEKAEEPEIKLQTSIGSCKKQVNIGRALNLTAAECNSATKVHLTGIKQATNEQYDGRIADGPHHLALVHRIDVVYLNAHITGRTLAVEDSYLHVLVVLKRRVDATTQIGLCNLRKRCQTSLEVSLLTFHFVVEVTS